MFATRERACSGYLLEYADTHLWLDAGAGTWQNLLQQIDYRDLTGVLLTHRHPDHTTDVFQAFHARRYGDQGEMPPIPLWAPQETLDRLVAFAERIKETFDMRAIAAGDSFEHGGARFSFYDMAHPVETVGVRVEYEGAVFAYSADTGPSAAFAELARDADLFVCEATLQDSDGEWEGHTHASRAAEIAASLGVKHLLLTHLPPARDLGLSLTEAHKASSKVKLELANDGQRFEVGV